MIRSIRRDLGASLRAIGWELAALLAFSLFVVALAYQSSPSYSITVGSPADAGYVQGFNASETNKDGPFRWSTSDSALLLPRVATRFDLALTLNGWRPDQPPPVVRLKMDGQPLAEVRTTPAVAEYHFEAVAPAPRRGPTVISIETDAFQPDGDRRSLGVMVLKASVRSLPALGPLTIPPPLHVFYLLAGVAFLFLAGERLGLGRRLPLAAGLVSAAVSVVVVVAPLAVAVRYNTIFLAGLLAYVLALLARAGAFRLMAILWAGLLFAGTAFNAAPDLYYFVAPVIIVLVLTRPQHERGDFALITALSTFVIVPLFLPGVAANGDQPIHLFWLSELDKLIENGVYFTRWAPDQAFGFGGPIFNFYAPLCWYVMEAFHLIGMTLVSAVKAALALDVLLAMLGTYLFARCLTTRAGAVVAAVAFGYFPYMVSEVHSRGELAEILAISLIPLTMWAFHQLVAGRRIAFLPVAAAFLGLVTLSHNITALFFMPFLLAYLMYICVRAGPLGLSRRRMGEIIARLGYGVIALGLGLAVSAFFWLPAVLEKKSIGGGLSPFDPRNPFPFHLWYIPYDWLYSLHLGNLYDDEGRYYGFGIHFALAAAAVLAAVIWQRRKCWRSTVPFFSAMLLVLVTLQLEVSQPFWLSVPLVGFIQYTWRLMDLTAICTSVLIGIGAGLCAERLRAWSAGSSLALRPQHIPAVSLVVLILVTSLAPLKPQFDTGGADFNNRSANLGSGVDVKMKNQFLPVWTDLQSIRRTDRPSPINISNPKKLRSVSPGLQRVNYATWSVTASNQTAVVFDVNYFPGWQSYVDGTKVKTYADDRTGRIVADVPAGNHRLELRFEDTPLRWGANIISIITALAILAFSAGLLFRRLSFAALRRPLEPGLLVRQ